MPFVTIDDPLIDGSEVTAVPFTVGDLGFPPAGSVVFIDGTGNVVIANFHSPGSYTADLTGFGRNVIAELSGPFGTNVSSDTTIIATDPNLVLSIAEFNAIPAAQWLANPNYTSVTLADTAANITALTNGQLGALAGAGITAIDATDTNLTLTVVQFKALGSVALAAADTVTLRDTWARISTLDLSTLAGKNIDLIDVTKGSFAITPDQYTALAGVAFTGSAAGLLTGAGSDIAALDLSGLAADHITGIDASDDQLSLTYAQYTNLQTQGVQLTRTDMVTLADDGAVIAALSATDIAGLAAGRIDKIDVTDNALALSLDQFNALGRIALSADDVLTLTGTAGDDKFSFAHQPFSVADHIDGGAGHDTLALEGDYGPLAFQAGTMTNIDKISFGAGHDYSLTLADANVAAGQHLRVAGSNLGAIDSLAFDGSAETDGSFRLIGGAGADTFTGGDGADLLSGGGGADTFVYSAVSQSVSTTYDTVTDFNASADHFDFDRTVSQVTNRSITDTGFGLDSNLGAAIDDSISSNTAVVVSISGGTLGGHSFLVVAASTFYQAGSDYVVDITGFSGTLTTANFT